MADNLRTRFRAWLDEVLPVEQRTVVEHERPFGQRFFDPGTLEPRLKILTAVVFAQVLVSLVMLALREAPALGPPLVLEELHVTIPWWNYIAAAAATLFGLTLVTLGAAAATRTAQVMLFLVFALLYSVEITIFFHQNRGLHFTLVFWTLAVCAAVVGVPASIRRRYSEDRKHLWVLRWFMGSCVALLAAIIIALVVTIPVAFAEYLMLLRLPLIFFFFVAGTDWAEMADEGVRTLLRPLSRLQPAAWLVLTLLVCGATLAIVVHSAWNATDLQRIAQSGHVLSRESTEVTSCSARWSSGESAKAIAGCISQMAAVPYALGLIVMGGVVLLALRVARFRGEWNDHLPWAALVGSIVLWGVASDAALLSGDLAVMTLMQLLLGAAAIAALKFCGRDARLRGLSPVAVFFLLLVCDGMPGLAPIAQPIWAPFKGLMLSAGIVSAIASIVIYRRRAQYRDVRDAFRLIVVLNVAFALLYVLFSIVYAWLREVSEHRAIAEAAILFAALIWEVLVSGSSVTNIDGRHFPRQSRVFLFFGYVSAVVAVVVFWGSLGGDAEMVKIGKLYAGTELFVQMGIAQFGPAFLLALFVLRFGKWYANRTDEDAAVAGRSAETLEPGHVKAPDLARDAQRG